MTCTIAKKEAKRLEKAAKFAAKATKEPTAPSKKKPAAEKESKEENLPFVNTTPKGDKKGRFRVAWELSVLLITIIDMTEAMAAGYNPIAVEASWYDWWNKRGYFSPTFGPDGKAKPEGLFVLPCPPPNVTGSLHIGHGLTVAIQDALVRW